MQITVIPVRNAKEGVAMNLVRKRVAGTHMVILLLLRPLVDPPGFRTL